MTDEERREAKSYADKHAVTFERIPLWNRLFNAYAAACESKRAEIETKQRVSQADTATINRLFADVEQLASRFEAERARSAKLIEAIRATSCHSEVVMVQFQLEEAIAEYEAKK